MQARGDLLGSARQPCKRGFGAVARWAASAGEGSRALVGSGMGLEAGVVKVLCGAQLRITLLYPHCGGQGSIFHPILLSTQRATEGSTGGRSELRKSRGAVIARANGRR